jgi:hypothetical protein
MVAIFEFVDYAGEPTTSLAQRRNNCITTSTWQSGNNASVSVIVENTGDEPGSCAVEFFLAVPTGNAPSALTADLCDPEENPMEPTALAPGDSTYFSLTYTVQDGDVGADTLYAQIQSGAPPYPNPSDMSQTCNSSKTVDVLSAPGVAPPGAPPAPGPPGHGGPGHGGPGHGGHGHGGHGHEGEGHEPGKKPYRGR